MENGISRLEFWSGVVLAVAPYLVQMYIRWRDSKDKEPEHETNQQVQRMTENEKQLQAWEEIAEGYAKQIERLRTYETENAELRPLLLKVALQAQDIKQCKDDKEDWKDYADKLARQLEGHSIIPHAFRRTPRDGDTQDKLKPISQKMKAVQDYIEKKTDDNSATIIRRNPEVGE